MIFTTMVSPTVAPRLPVIAFRAFKAERELEIWGARSARGPYTKIATYRIAAMSGSLGPKLREGDLQVPEGFYRIDRFNPHSRFHLSLGLNYPNSSDRKRGQAGNLGEDIFIHGNHVSAGCMAMTDPIIEPIFKLALAAKSRGEKNIPVSVFPCRLTDSNWRKLNQEYATRPDLLAFWSSLRPGYLSFEQTRLWPRPHVDARGMYVWPDLKHSGTR